MTTQELKQYIDKVLGNNLRCLLPSYWWKRLFSLTLDKVDEKLDAANIKTINGESVIGEGNLKVGITSVGSMEELNALEAEIGDVATVGVDGEYTKINTDECIIPGFDKIAERWDELTPVDKVDALGYSGDGEFGIYLATKNGNDDMVQAVYFNNSYSYQQYNNDTLRAISKSKLDELLAENDYRYIGKIAQEDVSTVFALYTKSPSSANAYIKGDTWTRLLKEGEGGSNITVDSELSDTSENPLQNKVVTAAIVTLDNSVALLNQNLGLLDTQKVDKVNGKQLSTEDFTSALKTKLEGLNNYDDTAIQNAVNSLTTQINTLVSGDASVAIESFNEIIAFLNGVEDSENLDSIIASIEQQIAGKQDTISDLDTIRSGASKGDTAIQEVKTINGQSIVGKGNITIEGGGSIDSELSATSENPVQNKVIYENLYGMNQQYIQMYEEQNRVFTNAINNVNTELLKKVDQSYVDNAIANAITTTLNTAV